MQSRLPLRRGIDKESAQSTDPELFFEESVDPEFFEGLKRIGDGEVWDHRIGQLPTLNLLSYPLIPEHQTIDFFIVMLILCRDSLIYLAIKHQLKFNRALKRQSNRINNLEIHFPIVRHFLCHFATGDSS